MMENAIKKTIVTGELLHKDNCLKCAGFQEVKFFLGGNEMLNEEGGGSER